MAGQTVSAHLDDDLVQSLRAVSTGEARPASQVIAAGLRSFLRLAPQARQVLYAMEGELSESEREHMTRLLSRQIVTAHRRLIEGRAIERLMAVEPDGSNLPPATEDDVIAEAIEAFR